MKRCVFLLAFVGLAGCMTCSTLDETMASWEGRHFTQLIEHWGPPYRVFDGEGGDNIYVWSSAPPAASSGGASAGKPTPVKQRVYWFWVDSDGVIYKWAWRQL